MTDDRCETCRFWGPTANHRDKQGDCRRTAPAPVLYALGVKEDAHFGATWMTTKADDWCGEYQPAGPQSLPDGDLMTKLELPVRTLNLLARGDIRTVGDLCRRTASDLLSFREISFKTVADLRKRLAKIGRHLAGEG